MIAAGIIVRPAGSLPRPEVPPNDPPRPGVLPIRGDYVAPPVVRTGPVELPPECAWEVLVYGRHDGREEPGRRMRKAPRARGT